MVFDHTVDSTLCRTSGPRALTLNALSERPDKMRRRKYFVATDAKTSTRLKTRNLLWLVVVLCQNAKKAKTTQTPNGGRGTVSYIRTSYIIHHTPQTTNHISRDFSNVNLLAYLLRNCTGRRNGTGKN